MSDLDHREFERKCLKAHNKYRALHGSPALQLDDELTDVANAWAEELTTLRNLRHSSNPCVGENIYTVRAENLTGDVPVRVWYDEIKNYDFDRPCEYLRAIHFTQLIWKESRRLGVGFARRGMLFIVVVNYDPPGNVLGEYRENVPMRIAWNYIGSISSDSLTEYSDTSMSDNSCSIIPSEYSTSIPPIRSSDSAGSLTTRSTSSRDDFEQYGWKRGLKIKPEFSNCKKAIIPRNLRQYDSETDVEGYTIFSDPTRGIIPKSPLSHYHSYDEVNPQIKSFDSKETLIWKGSTSGDGYDEYGSKTDMIIKEPRTRSLPAEYSLLLLLIIAIGGAVGGFIYYNK